MSAFDLGEWAERAGKGILLGGKRPRRRFSDEFKRDAVEIVRTSGKPIRQVANELGIHNSTLGNWVPPSSCSLSHMCST